jgi:biopolymer transport protein ExbB
MDRKLASRWCGAAAVALCALMAATAVWAQETVPADPMTPMGMSLFDIIKEGGAVMVVLGMLSVVALALIITYFIIISPRRETPPDLVRRLTVLLEGNDVAGCAELCDEREEMLASVVRAGLRVAGHDRSVVLEAMQGEGLRQAATLGQYVSYLNNIAAIAPMLGILGTVLGMIRAFNGIALTSEAVKPMVLASGIAEALVTTAAGLVVAIPVLGFYFFFRGRAQKVLSAVETASSELIDPLTQVKV